MIKNKIFKQGIGIAEKNQEKRRDCWGGNLVKTTNKQEKQLNLTTTITSGAINNDLESAIVP